MNFGKKWLALILVVTLLCTLCACTGKGTEKTPTVTTTAATTANGTTVDTTAAPTDGDETTTTVDTTATTEVTSTTEGVTDTTATEATAVTTVSTTTASTTKKPAVTTAATTKKTTAVTTAKTTQKTTVTTKKTTAATTAKTTQKTTATTKKTTAATTVSTTKPTNFIGSSGPDGVHNDVEYEIFRLLNEEREKNGLQPLLLATQYHHLAEIRAEECIESFSHTRPDGTSCFSVLGDDWGTKIFSAGENLAAGHRNAASVHWGWKNSEGHYANMMSSGFNAIAIAVAYDENGRAYYCELFVGIA